MKDLEIVISDLPYLPLNRAKMLARGMLIKTPLCREFEKDLTSRLLEYDFSDFLSGFNPSLHYLDTTYNIFVPKDLYFTKAGQISNRACDTDSIKVLQDTIFRSIGVDDKFIRDLHVISRPSHDGNWNYRVVVGINQLKDLP